MCRTRSRLFSLIAVSSFMFVGACFDDSRTNIPSDQLPTSQIFATFQVIEDGGDQVFVEAQLTRDLPPNQPGGDDVFVRLRGSDQLWFAAGEHFSRAQIEGNLYDALRDFSDTQAPMQSAQEIFYTFLGWTINVDGDRYFARLPRHPDGDYSVAFLREGYTSAIDSSVVLPAGFSVTAPLLGDNFSRSSDPIQVSWAPAEADALVRLEVKSSCLDGGFAIYSTVLNHDPGSYELDAGVLESDSLSGYCTSTLNVIRSRMGSFDPAFTGGHVAGHQIRSVSVSTTD